MNKLIIIAAVGKNLEIGYKNKLIWSIKEDMKFFKSTTLNHHVLMGKNTYLSIGKPLENRINLVLSSNSDFSDEVKIFNNISSFLDYKNKILDDIYIIGGESIYKEFVDIADEIILTKIDSTSLLCDSYFPNFNKNNYDKIILKEVNDNNPKFKIVKYIRK